MSSITIRNLDPAIKERLRVRAAEYGAAIAYADVFAARGPAGRRRLSIS